MNLGTMNNILYYKSHSRHFIPILFLILSDVN